MLIEHFDLEIITPPCDPRAERFAAHAWLTADISAVLPYLNATLRGAVYNRAANALTWTKAGHYVVFHPFEVALSNVADREAAQKEIERLIALINRTWEQRAAITPDYESHQRPTPMAVYRLLPQTNCKQCGEPTCFTFALKLAASQRAITDCPPLREPQHAAKLAALRAIVIQTPAIGSRGGLHE